MKFSPTAKRCALALIVGNEKYSPCKKIVHHLGLQFHDDHNPNNTLAGFALSVFASRRLMILISLHVLPSQMCSYLKYAAKSKSL